MFSGSFMIIVVFQSIFGNTVEIELKVTQSAFGVHMECTTFVKD